MLYRWNVSLSTLPEVLLKADNNSIYSTSRSPSEFYVTVKENIRTTAPSHFQVIIV